VPSDLDLQREAEEGTDEDDRAENSHTDESGLGRNRSNDVTGDEEFQSEKNGSPKHSAKLPVHVVLAPNDSSDSGRSRDRSSNHDHCNTYTVDGHPYVLDNIAVAHLAPFVGAARTLSQRMAVDKHCCSSNTRRNIRRTLLGDDMNRVPDSELVLVPGGSLITPTPEEGRALALTMARHTVHNIQPDLDVLGGGRPNYATTPESLIAASQVVAIEFQTIAAANDYWRK
jgi:hypothetical protein